MNTPDTISDYVEALPDRILATADKHPMVKMTIERAYIPLIASDLYRGQVLTGSHKGDFQETFGAVMMNAAEQNPQVTFDMQAGMARVMAMQLKAGAIARKRLH